MQEKLEKFFDRELEMTQSKKWLHLPNLKDITSCLTLSYPGF